MAQFVILDVVVVLVIGFMLFYPTWENSRENGFQRIIFMANAFAFLLAIFVSLGFQRGLVISSTDTAPFLMAVSKGSTLFLARFISSLVVFLLLLHTLRSFGYANKGDVVFFKSFTKSNSKGKRVLRNTRFVQMVLSGARQQLLERTIEPDLQQIKQSVAAGANTDEEALRLAVQKVFDALDKSVVAVNKKHIGTFLNSAFYGSSYPDPSDFQGGADVHQNLVIEVLNGGNKTWKSGTNATAVKLKFGTAEVIVLSRSDNDFDTLETYFFWKEFEAYFQSL